MRPEPNVRRITLTALMAALVFVLTSIPRVPVPATGGYVHLGDAGITFAAFAFGPTVAMAAGAMGTGLADLLGFPQWAIFSVFIHGFQGWAMATMVGKRLTPPGLSHLPLLHLMDALQGRFCGLLPRARAREWSSRGYLARGARQITPRTSFSVAYVEHQAAVETDGRMKCDSPTPLSVVLAIVVGVAIVVVGYFVAGLILEGAAVAMVEIVPNSIQAASGGIIGFPLYLAVRSAYPALERDRRQRA